MVFLTLSLCIWFKRSANIIGIGKAIIRLSKLISTVFFIAFTAIEVLKNWVKYLKIGLESNLLYYFTSGVGYIQIFETELFDKVNMIK